MKKKFALRALCGAATLAVAGMAHAQISGNTIRIGVLEDLSGPYTDAAGPGAVVAARLALEDAAQLLPGVKIEVVSADHQNKADVASSVVRKWIDTEGVDVIVGVGNSSAALAVQQVTREKNVPHLNTTAATTALTNEQCSPMGIHWVYDTYSLANGTGAALTESGSKKWFFLTADYAFGHSMEKLTSEAVTRLGGQVVGSVRTPFPTHDFASFLLRAQSSGADTLGLINAGNEFVTSLKQAQEFGITRKMKVAGMLSFITEIHSLGLPATKGLVLTSAWYWDQDDASRAFAKRFAARHNNRMPTQLQAGIHSAITHYLKAVKAINTDAGPKVVRQMKDTPVQDMFTANGRIREDGRHVFPMKLVRVKTPEESRGPWDYYQVLRTIPAETAFLPLAQSTCPLVKKN